VIAHTPMKWNLSLTHVGKSFIEMNELPWKWTMPTLNVGSGGRPRDRAVNEGDIRIDIVVFPTTTAAMDAHHLGFRERCFDEVFCFEVLEHLESPIVALREFKRVLKPDGEIVMTIPNIWEWRRIFSLLRHGIGLLHEVEYPDDHKQSWDLYELESLAIQVGLTISSAQWIDWYPRKEHKLDPLLRRLLPSALFGKHLKVVMKIREQNIQLVMHQCKTPM